MKINVVEINYFFLIVVYYIRLSWASMYVALLLRRRQSNALTSLVGQAKQGFVPRDFRDTSKLYAVSEEIGFFGNQGMSLGT